MKTNHYPSLENCKKLTENWFQNTENSICTACNWDWIETCNNPDHSFFSLVNSSWRCGNESRCPCCWYDENHKIKNSKCPNCLWYWISKDIESMRIYDETYVCPSIAELLYELPKQFVHETHWFRRAFEFQIWWNNYVDKYSVQYYCFINRETLINKCDNLPNALASMWLWLKENDLLHKK